MMEARETWFERQLDLDPERVVFLDETATATNMERRYGRGTAGRARCRIAGDDAAAIAGIGLLHRVGNLRGALGS